MEWRALLVGMAVLLAWPQLSAAQAPQCLRSEFEAVVDEAAAQLRALNQANRPRFQDKLRELKDKRGWSHSQFLADGAEFVRDDTIATYDQRTEDLLTRISSGGEAGAAAKNPDCNALTELRGRMRELVDTQQAKWAYMFDKIAQALQK